MLITDAATLELYLLSGEPIPISPTFAVPLVFLRDIKKVGWKTYNEHLHFATLNKESLGDLADAIVCESNLDLIQQLSCIPATHQVFCPRFCSAFAFFFKRTVTYDLQKHCFYIAGDDGEQIAMNDAIFDGLQRILVIQVTGNIENSLPINPADAKAKEILAKMEKGRAAVAKAKQQNTDGANQPSSFGNLISAYCAKNTSGINMLNVWDMPLFAFNSQLEKLKVIEQYDFNYRALLAGAKNVELQHWLL